MKRLILIGAMLLMITGCASGGIVPLHYTPVQAVKGDCPGVVSLIKFEDERTSEELGWTKEGEPVRAAGDLGEWVARAVFTEMANDDCDVRYHEMEGAFPADAELKGQVLRASLEPTEKTAWKAVLQVRFELLRDGKTIYAEKGFAEVEKPVLPGVASREELLDEALGGVIDVVLPSIMRELRSL